MTEPTDKQAARILKEIHTKNSKHWEKIADTESRELFHLAAGNVPAYSKFLKKHRVDPKKITTQKDFEQLPSISKKDYLRAHPLSELAWGGDLRVPLVFTSTSGSTGEPFYFPRGYDLSWQYSLIVEEFLKHGNIGTSKKNSSTLVVLGFGMGVWIGGLITYQAFDIAARRGKYPVSIITPGINQGEIINALKNLSPQYDRTILIGYPPFIKDILAAAQHEHIRLEKLNLRLMFAAETFSEEFRDYVIKKAKIRNAYNDMLSIYGSADIGAMAGETGIAILVKRLMKRDDRLSKALFGQSIKMPTVAQYNPYFIQFEDQGGELLLTGQNAIPLIRYRIGDNGTVFSFDTLLQKFRDCGYDLRKEAKRAGITDTSELPFVCIYERSDFSTKLYGATIFPEHVKAGLTKETLEDIVTGKFTMLTKFDKKHNAYLEVNVELSPNTADKTGLEEKIADCIVESLRKHSAEYQNNHNHAPVRMIPKIILWPHQHPTYFSPGVKQQWLKKS